MRAVAPERSISWLCPTPADRERFLEMQKKLHFARVATIVMGAIIAGVMVPQLGWKMVAVLVVMVTLVLAGSRHLDRRRRPEVWVFFTTVINMQVMLAAAAVLAGGPRTPIASLVVLPVAIVATRFSSRGLLVGAPLSAVIVAATTVGVDPSY